MWFCEPPCECIGDQLQSHPRISQESELKSAFANLQNELGHQSQVFMSFKDWSYILPRSFKFWFLKSWAGDRRFLGSPSSLLPPQSPRGGGLRALPCPWVFGRQGAAWTPPKSAISGPTLKHKRFWTSGHKPARLTSLIALPLSTPFSSPVSRAVEAMLPLS